MQLAFFNQARQVRGTEGDIGVDGANPAVNVYGLLRCGGPVSTVTGGLFGGLVRAAVSKPCETPAPSPAPAGTP